MFISDSIKALEDSIRLNEATVKALSEVVLSKRVSTTIQNVPTPTNEFFHQKGTSYLYGDEPSASDMFNGEQASDANGTPYPVISTFEIGKIPNVLEDKLAEKITALSSINDTTNLVISTLIGTLSEYASEIARNSKKVESKSWKTFKVGEYWPVGYGFSNNVDYCVTDRGVSSLAYHVTSKYAFLKINPSKDEKYHFIRVNVDHASELAIPAIFVILDSNDAVDGDQFEFRVEYYSDNEVTDQSKWPEVLFFDSCYNSNSIPQPSETSDYEGNEIQVNHSVKIDGVDYFYMQSIDLPENAKINHKLSNVDRVFVSAAELNDKVINHFGEYRSIPFDSFKESKYLGYGIQKNTSLKVYSNRDFSITCEVPDESEVEGAKFIANKTIRSSKNAMEFNGGADFDIFYGRPSSFFTPKASTNLLSPVAYCNPIEWIKGNTLPQFKLNEFSSKVNSPVSNGIVFEYELSDFSGKSAIRLGHFETILGLTIQFEETSATLSYYNASSLTQIALGVVPKLKVLVGFVFEHGAFCARYIVKSNSTTLHDSGLIVVSDSGYSSTLLAKFVLGDSRLDSSILSYLTESDVYSYWSPVISVYSTAGSTVKMSSLFVSHSLRKEEFKSKCVGFSTSVIFPDPNTQYPTTYSSTRGIMPPIIKKASEIKGHLASVDARNSSTYMTSKGQGELITAYRVGFTYSSYKGEVVVSKHAEFDPIVVNRSKLKVSVETPSIVSIDAEGDTPNTTSLSNLSEDGGSVESIDSTPGTRLIAQSSIRKVSSQPQVDSIYGKYGWKVTTYYQSVG